MLENNLFQKQKFTKKNVIIIYYLLMGKIRKFWMILGLENSLLRSDFAPFRLTVIRCVYPQNKLIFFGVF